MTHTHTHIYVSSSVIQTSPDNRTVQEQPIPQSEYPLNVGKSAVPVEVPVTPKLGPDMLEIIDDEGGWVDSEEEFKELFSV